MRVTMDLRCRCGAKWGGVVDSAEAARKIEAEFLHNHSMPGCMAKPYPPPAGSVACPSCGGRLHRTVEQGVGWQGECTACHQRGPWRETETAALGAWLSFADSYASNPRHINKENA